jgi:hypothetical protein
MFRLLTTSPTNSAALSERNTVGKLPMSQKIDINAFAMVVAREFGNGFSQTHRLKQQTHVNTFFVSHVMVSNCITRNGQEYSSVRVHAATPDVPRSARQNSHLLHHRRTSP